MKKNNVNQSRVNVKGVVGVVVLLLSRLIIRIIGLIIGTQFGIAGFGSGSDSSSDARYGQMCRRLTA